ncbi:MULTISPECIES: ATP-binding cassette domain-containing protein [Pseudescherichia]|uniref:ATP-binding cassette domain-containing protein n=1 Tax=Pseudescherichia TaxID=2055880 RepID=UPI0035E417EF
MSLTLHPVEVVATSGISGCGKSTLVKLILGFWSCSADSGWRLPCEKPAFRSLSGDTGLTFCSLL